MPPKALKKKVANANVKIRVAKKAVTVAKQKVAVAKTARSSAVKAVKKASGQKGGSWYGDILSSITSLPAGALVGATMGLQGAVKGLGHTRKRRKRGGLAITDERGTALVPYKARSSRAVTKSKTPATKERSKIMKLIDLARDTKVLSKGLNIVGADNLGSIARVVGLGTSGGSASGMHKFVKDHRLVSRGLLMAGQPALASGAHLLGYGKKGGSFYPSRRAMRLM
jgi:hypothetical protein